MCRLGGIVLGQGIKRTEEDYARIMEDLLALLIKMENALGGDGNSITFHYSDGSYKIVKEHRQSHRLFSRFEELKNALKGAIIVQMHARLSTCGSSKQHENMHPFVHGNIIGCHNGQIDDVYLWDLLDIKPYSTTDSEAIFAHLSVHAPTLHPKQVQTTLDHLYGSYALTVVSKAKPRQLFIIAQNNPLCYYYDRKHQELWFASTDDLLPDTLNIPVKQEKYTVKGKTYTRTVSLVRELKKGEGVYFRSHKKGVSIEHVEFEVKDQPKHAFPYAWSAYDYAYDYEEVTKEQALIAFKNGQDILLVFDNGKDYYALDTTDIENHEGSFLVEYVY